MGAVLERSTALSRAPAPSTSDAKGRVVEVNPRVKSLPRPKAISP